MPEPDRPDGALGDAVRGLQDAMHGATIAIARAMGLNATDASALEHISYAQGKIGPTELGARLGVSASSATEVVQRLVDSGHLERHRDERDRRRYVLVPTGAARDEVRTHLIPLRQRLDELEASFPAAERAAIASYLRGAADVFRDATRGAPER
ncbi:MarR family winged helix-turn-helix transcriptional regulator [Microbacterium thalli]|uniref:MarR family winged helix-turn-helix transcriptional regulator n=1 Tax=Microbacterium thalli TaxID=3027921 RepID=A0ABT5SDB5_9MICO|nr:MarR family winged helix-turn-helix transcriptional regulator [Microbacterium thalli]MDD7960776.1 MarR family winged helix-turn-helix transcriptional regulator [Microbacterium thalli]